MSTHTPAPWTLKPQATNHQTLTGATAGLIADIHKDEDARLIAAAPELLDACRCALADLEGIVDELPGDHPAYLTIQELRAAITKATGEAQ
jgi:hypothetical protein